MNIPPFLVNLVAEFEGYRSHAYLCPAGVWTIGHGTTRIAGKPVVKGLSVTPDRAMALLRDDLERFAGNIYPWFEVTPTQGQGAAMVSLAYNIGASAFRCSSVLRKFNQRDISGAGEAFLLWNKATVKGRRVVLPGLVARRERERSVFLSLGRFRDLFPDLA